MSAPEETPIVTSEKVEGTANVPTEGTIGSLTANENYESTNDEGDNTNSTAGIPLDITAEPAAANETVEKATATGSNDDTKNEAKGITETVEPAPVADDVATEIEREKDPKEGNKTAKKIDEDDDVEMKEEPSSEQASDNYNKDIAMEDAKSEDANDATPSAAANTTTTAVSTSTTTGKKRGRGGASNEKASGVSSGSVTTYGGSGSGSYPIPLDSVTIAAIFSASQYASNCNWNGLSMLLTSALTPSSSGSSGGGGGGGTTNTSSIAKQQQQIQQQIHSGDVSSITTTSTFIIPTPDMVVPAATKACWEQPPWVHWSKADMAPQLKIIDSSVRLQLQGAMRGYRMARASHGVSIKSVASINDTTTSAASTNTVGSSSTPASSSSTVTSYYYEIIVLPGPSATEILKSLPANARLGPGLREQLTKAVEWEKQQSKKPKKDTEAREQTDTETQSQPQPPPKVGGHVRVGWSMRTGDLQAPVGYDKWSYGIRDIGGSIIHCSQRQDHWGGVDCSEPGTVIGCSISLDSATSPSTTNLVNSSSTTAAANGTASTNASNNPEPSNDYITNNHIRFFKNGECMGEFMVDEESGKRYGGEAYMNIELGTYYPAVSCYMGGSIKTNFGPYWIYPPKRGKLPLYMKQKLLPVSTVCPIPPHPDTATIGIEKVAKLFRSGSSSHQQHHQQAFRDAVRTEADIQYKAYQEYYKNYINDIRIERDKRGLPTNDLPVINDDNIHESLVATKDGRLNDLIS